MNDFKIILEAMIDNSSLTNAQKQLAKERLKISADIDFSNFVSEKQKIQQLANEINKILGDSLKPKEALSWANQYWKQMQSGAIKTQREQEKLNQAQKKSSLATQEKYYQRIINNNKTIYSLKEKLLHADEKQTQEIQNQITKLEKRNQYNYGQLNKKGLTDNSWEWEVNTSKEVLENRLRINQEKLKDVALSKQIAEVNKIQLLTNGGIKNDYTTQIAQLEGNFRRLGLSQDEVSQKTAKVSSAFGELKTRVNQPFNESNYQEIINLNDALQRELVESSNEYTRLQASFKGFATEQQRLSLANTIEAWNQKNTAATREVIDENQRYIISLRDLSSEMRKIDFDRINTGFKQNENSMRAMNRLGKSLKEQFKQAYESFTMWLSASTLVMKVVSETKEAITELKEVNTLLTEISKANDKLTKEQLAQIADDGFDVASNYGKSVTHYLSGVQEASRAGYENAEAMAELSIAIQGAGDVTEDIANKYVIATDKAYGLKGSVEELTKVFDGSNYITNKNAVNMTELADGMSIVGSTAASFGIEVNETTAALGTMIASTQQSGSEMARAFRAILLNIRQVSDEEEDIDAEGLTKYEKACDALGVSLKETRNGVLQTRDAMEVLKELSVEYNKLEEGDLRRTKLLNSVGGKLRANALDALLKNQDMYSKMLTEYEQGAGSMAREAEKSANNWEGSLNRVNNTWYDTVENVANSDAIITMLNGFNGLLQVLNKVTDELGSLGTIGVIGGGILGAKNAGKCRMSVRISNCFEYALHT